MHAFKIVVLLHYPNCLHHAQIKRNTLTNNFIQGNAVLFGRYSLWERLLTAEVS